MARVVLRGVSKRYGHDRPAVSSLDLEIRDGEFLVLVGPSGCGKSTVLRMIAGLEEITAGEVSIGDRVVNELSPRERDIAMVFQSYALYPHLDVFDNIAFSLRVRGTPRAEIDRRVRESAQMLGIDGLLRKRPRELSGGERQRVALGRAIIRNPQVFLFDEPLSNLDAKLRVQMRAEITALHRRLGITTIYVTHDQVEAMTMGQRIAVLRDGVLQQVADPITLYDRPSNRFVGGFIGAPPMNFLDAERETERGAERDAERDAEGTYRLAGSATVTLPGAGGRARVAVGIRPEDVAIARSGDGHIAGTAQLVERTGAETYVYAACGATTLVVRDATPPAPAVGSALSLRLRLDKAHLFDVETGARLPAAGAAIGSR